MSKNVVVKLKKSIKKEDGNEISELSFREPNVGDLMAAERYSGNTGQTVAMMSAMTGVDISDLQKMGVPDYRKCDREVSGLMGNSEGGDGGTSPS